MTNSNIFFLTLDFEIRYAKKKWLFRAIKARRPRFTIKAKETRP